MINKKIGAAVVGMIVFQWSSVYWLGSANLAMAQGVASVSLVKPFVYRQLVFTLARLIESLGVRIDLAIVLLMTAAGIGFYLALHDLAFSIYRQDQKGEFLLLALVVAGLVFFGDHRWPYDLFSAWFFTLALLYIGQDDKNALAVLFPLACLNRETAFLLILVTAAIGILRGDKVSLEETLLYQVTVFVLIQVLLRTIFYNNAGLEVWIVPVKNIQKFIAQPWTTLLHGFVAFGLLRIALKDWTWKPQFFRLAFVVLLPPLSIMYIVSGNAFEVRVFWEVYPVLAMLLMPTLHSMLVWRPRTWIVRT